MKFSLLSLVSTLLLTPVMASVRKTADVDSGTTMVRAVWD